jgi:hypothetical protein
VRDELVTGLESDRDWRELLTLEVKIIIATHAANLLVVSAGEKLVGVMTTI